MKKIPIKIKFLTDKKQFPSYQTNGSSGMDVHALCENPILIPAGETRKIPTGFSVEIPQGYEIQVRPRSGLAAKFNVGIINSPGTIDCDYRGEVQILLTNFSKTDFEVRNGDRIAQLVVQEVIKAVWEESENLLETERNKGGFGHTGR
ncbi:dUTP diphosphatase [bacterium]|nr:dUTP diphosphatase [bacterium]